MKNFGRVHEKPRERRESLKRELGEFVDLRESLARKRQVVFLRGIDTPIHTMVLFCHIIFVCGRF